MFFFALTVDSTVGHLSYPDATENEDDFRTVDNETIAHIQEKLPLWQNGKINDNYVRESKE
jgi:hypothetical protein